MAAFLTGAYDGRVSLQSRIATVLTIATCWATPSSGSVTTAFQLDRPTPVSQTAAPAPDTVLAPANSDDASREQKTIAWLILLLKEGRGTRY